MTKMQLESIKNMEEAISEYQNYVRFANLIIEEADNKRILHMNNRSFEAYAYAIDIEYGPEQTLFCIKWENHDYSPDNGEFCIPLELLDSEEKIKEFINNKYRIMQRQIQLDQQENLRIKRIQFERLKLELGET